MTSTKIVFLTGAVALVGNIKRGKHDAAGILRISLATLALAFLFGQAENTPLAKPVRMLAYLSLLTAILYYTGNIVGPAKSVKKVVKKHG